MPGRFKKNRMLSFLLWNFVVWISAASLTSGVAAQAPANPSGDQKAQIEKGRQVVAQVCAACHTTIVRMVQVHKLSADEWKDTVYYMISRGAQVKPDEIDAVTAYLVATAGRGGAAGAQAPGGGGRGGGGRGAGGAGQETGEVDGRAIHQRACQQCHDLATASAKAPSEDWTAVVARMTSYGARVSSADQAKLIGYLEGLGK